MKEILKIILNKSLKILKQKRSFLTNQIRNSIIKDKLNLGREAKVKVYELLFSCCPIKQTNLKILKISHFWPKNLINFDPSKKKLHNWRQTDSIDAKMTPPDAKIFSEPSTHVCNIFITMRWSINSFVLRGQLVTY